MSLSRWMLVPLILGSMCAGPALAQPSQAPAPDDHEARVEAHMQQLFNRLGLTPEQRKQFAAIRDRHRANMASVREQLRTKRQALFHAIMATDATPEKAKAIQREVSALQARLDADRLDAWFECRKVLTPDQLKRLPTIRRPHS
jgi:Spy/CpxP family protein refolding chaperone